MLILEKAMATHSSTLAWKIPWTVEPGRLQPMGSLGVWHDRVTSLSLFTFMHWRRKWQHTSVLAWRIPGMGEPGGLPPMGLHRVRHNWSDLAAAAALLIQSICLQEKIKEQNSKHITEENVVVKAKKLHFWESISLSLKLISSVYLTCRYY